MGLFILRCLYLILKQDFCSLLLTGLWKTLDPNAEISFKCRSHDVSEGKKAVRRKDCFLENAYQWLSKFTTISWASPGKFWVIIVFYDAWSIIPWAWSWSHEQGGFNDYNLGELASMDYSLVDILIWPIKGIFWNKACNLMAVSDVWSKSYSRAI